MSVFKAGTTVPPNYRKVTDRVAMFPVAFGPRVGFCIESCYGLPYFLFVLGILLL